MANDFLYTSQAGRTDELEAALDGVPDGADVISALSGPWGSLVVTGSRYGGFQPVETDSAILVVVGAPVLNYASNSHLADKASDAGTRAILSRLRRSTIKWSDDLSGPFAILLIHKSRRQLTVITDLMSFIPVYMVGNNGRYTLGTHTDALAEAQPERLAVDWTSLVDLALHGVVTYPYTNYTTMRQLPPASVVSLDVSNERGQGRFSESAYWQPVEQIGYPSIKEAACDLESSLVEYTESVTGNMTRVAHLLSAGEDSRVVASLIPRRSERHAFVVADTFNREARIAQRVAHRLGSVLHFVRRPPSFYLDNMAAMSALTGRNAQSTHAHFFQLCEAAGMTDFQAVLGGYFADSILKASAARKSPLSSRLWFLPDRAVGGETRTRPVHSHLFAMDYLEAVTARRVQHFENVSQLRPRSAHEWFSIWPASMRKGLPNITTSRRVMASFEPFTSAGVVKAGAQVPIEWKLNHKLFRLGTMRFLRPTRNIPHGNGRYPYYPWWISSALQLPTWGLLAAKRLSAALGFERTYDGPWSDWYGLARDGALAHSAEPFGDGFEALPLKDRSFSLVELMRDERLAIDQRATILSLSMWLSSANIA